MPVPLKLVVGALFDETPDDKVEVTELKPEVTDPRMEVTSERTPVDAGVEDPVKVELIPVAGPVVAENDAEAVFEASVLVKLPVGEIRSLEFEPVAVGSNSDVGDPKFEVTDAKSDVTPDTTDDNKLPGVVVDAYPLETPVEDPVMPVDGVGVPKSVADSDTPVVDSLTAVDDAEAEGLTSAEEVVNVGRISDVTPDTTDEPPIKDESRSPEDELATEL